MLARKARAMLGSDETGEYPNPALGDDKIMEAAAEALTPTFCNPQSSPFASVDRRELIKVDNAVSDAVDCAVRAFRCQVIEHNHSRIVLREIMLQRKNLPAVTQRALRQQ